MKHIMITGASGFVGTYLSKMLVERGYRITGLGTSLGHDFENVYENFSWISEDTSQSGAWQDIAAGSDIIINLAGRTIFKPWTKTYKKAMYDSRVLTTRHLVAGLGENWHGHLLSASAVGYYGDRGNTVLAETEPCGNDFLAQVCKDWESAALDAKAKGAVVSMMRFGVVLGPDGGALDVMGKAFKWFVGGPLGNGRQWFPWIHIEDLAAAVEFLIDNKADGAFNFCGPEPVRQKAFAQALGQSLKRPAIMPAPAFMVRMVMGELGASLLQGQKSLPKGLENKGFTFKYNTVDQALNAVYRPEI
ncbi:MAG: TIGR01777 family protein [Desulfobacterales bacterium]|nr:MAG: TIGR01777 family protein [Desulfobacterales bacterium]